MGRDLGLDDWLLEIDAASGNDIATALLRINADHDAARAKVLAAMDKVADLQRAMMTTLRESLQMPAG